MMLKSVSNDQIDSNDFGAVLPARFHVEPLTRQSDVEEFRHAVTSFQDGSWDEDRWKTFRLRFGIYAELAPGKHMLRVKIPGGRMSLAWAKSLADINRRLCRGRVHLTTRQDVQIYGVALEELQGVIEALFDADLTTRESSGATFRNVTACPLAGVCPSEHVDAADVAEKLTTSWLRHPLVQHMPRKFKTSVSGCAQDCGSVTMDDLGFIATVVDGKKGFRVLAGGGLGAQPRLAVEVLDFVEEDELATVQEAMARFHHKYSDRSNRAKSRLKFLVDRFGHERFIELFKVELEKVRGLPQRPTKALTWRDAETTDKPVLPGGQVPQTDGKWAAVIRPNGGSFNSDDLEAVAALAETLGGKEFRVTRDQNLVAIGFDKGGLEAFVAGSANLSAVRVVDEPKGADNVVSCPGTSTCPIGITNSSAFSELIAEDPSFDALPQTRIRISGCHNSCGQHHVADFGLHGMGKKIEGRPVPHYQFHIGGLHDQGSALGIGGPIVPAKRAKEALKIVISNYAETAETGEGVRAWADRLGKDYFVDLLGSFRGSLDVDDPDTYLDYGKKRPFTPPASTHGECSAPAVIAEYLADLAEAGRDDLQRFLAVGDVAGAMAAGHVSLISGVKRLLAVAQVEAVGSSEEELITKVRGLYPSNRSLLAALDAVLEAASKVGEAGDFAAYDSVLGDWIVMVNDNIEARLASQAILVEASA